jgi:hypothetical protein
MPIGFPRWGISSLLGVSRETLFLSGSVPNTLVNPVKIVRAFFKLCNFKFRKANQDSSKLNCVIRRTKISWFADDRRSVSCSTSTKNVQYMVTKVGID